MNAKWGVHIHNYHLAKTILAILGQSSKKQVYYYNYCLIDSLSYGLESKGLLILALLILQIL